MTLRELNKLTNRQKCALLRQLVKSLGKVEVTGMYGSYTVIESEDVIQGTRKNRYANRPSWDSQKGATINTDICSG